MENNQEEEIEEYETEEEYYARIIQELNINTDKIKKNLKKYKKKDELIVLIESGSLAPPHRMHIGLMEITKKFLEEDKIKKRRVVGGFIIPSSDKYVKQKLKNDFIPLKHRIKMTKLLIKNSDWMECLDWGFANSKEIKNILDRILIDKFPKYNIKSFLVFGIDYYMKHKIFLNNEHICIYRPGYDIKVVQKMYPKNLIFVEGTDEDISSTLIRKAIRENDTKTISKLTDKVICEYIKNNNIFNEK